MHGGLNQTAIDVAQRPRTPFEREVAPPAAWPPSEEATGDGAVSFFNYYSRDNITEYFTNLILYYLMIIFFQEGGAAPPVPESRARMLARRRRGSTRA